MDWQLDLLARVVDGYSFPAAFCGATDIQIIQIQLQIHASQRDTQLGFSHYYIYNYMWRNIAKHA